MEKRFLRDPGVCLMSLPKVISINALVVVELVENEKRRSARARSEADKQGGEPFGRRRGLHIEGRSVALGKREPHFMADQCSETILPARPGKVHVYGMQPLAPLSLADQPGACQSALPGPGLTLQKNKQLVLAKVRKLVNLILAALQVAPFLCSDRKPVRLQEP